MWPSHLGADTSYCSGVSAQTLSQLGGEGTELKAVSPPHKNTTAMPLPSKSLGIKCQASLRNEEGFG